MLSRDTLKYMTRINWQKSGNIRTFVAGRADVRHVILLIDISQLISIRTYSTRTPHHKSNRNLSFRGRMFAFNYLPFIMHSLGGSSAELRSPPQCFRKSNKGELSSPCEMRRRNSFGTGATNCSSYYLAHQVQVPGSKLKVTLRSNTVKLGGIIISEMITRVHAPGNY